MDGKDPLRCFSKEWRCYLEQHGHRSYELAKHPGALVSRDRKGQRYRWLLWVIEGNALLLRDDPIRMIRIQTRVARRLRQRCFVVVKFGYPGGVAIAVPAFRAIRAKLLTSDRGAIPWNQ